MLPFAFFLGRFAKKLNFKKFNEYNAGTHVRESAKVHFSFSRQVALTTRPPFQPERGNLTTKLPHDKS
jgi:hypothetical protein